MQNSNTQFSVISHTHWDREWHMSFERFRMRLVSLIDNLLDILETDSEYVFHLDAQSICVEDYLVIRPERDGDIRKHIADGRILIGPWYVQNDFYLTSGEATVRNLLIGKKMAEEYGKCDTVGYAPDQFGNISQLPQILSGFDINNFIFGRGYSFPLNPGEDREKKPGPTEFLWCSKDGSQLLAIHLAFWYNNAQRFPADIDKSLNLVLGNEQDFADRAATPYLLLMNGVDHLEAQEDLRPILDQVNRRLPEGKSIQQDTLSNYIEKIRRYLDSNPVAVDRYEGELRNGWDVQTHLSNTASSRIYLKQQNVQAQVLLENHLEPLYSMISLLGADDLYPIDYLRYLWKMLMQNHPHDSICGCSIDAVHRNMEDRNIRIFEAGGELLERGMAFLSAHADRGPIDNDEYIITVVNTLSRERSSCFDIELYFRQEDKVGGFEITTMDGLPVDYEIQDKKQTFFTSLSPINLPGNLFIDAYTARIFLPSIPAFSVSCLKVTPTATPAALAEAEEREVDSARIENSYMKLSISKDGRGILTDKRNNQTYSDFYTIEETGDMGNSYEFVRPENGRTYTADDMKISRITRRSGRLGEEVTIEYIARLPERFDFQAMERSSNSVDNHICIVFALQRDSPVLDIGCKVKNRSKDHRLRLIINSGLESNIVQVAAPFEIVERGNADYVPHWSSGDCPNSGFVTISDTEHGLSILNEGIAEYNHLEGKVGRIAFTLVRGTGFVNGNINNQSSHWECPENQVLRDVHHHIAVYPHVKDALAAQTYQVYQDFLVPVLTHFDACDMTKFTGGRAPVQASGVAEHFFREPEHAEITTATGKELIKIYGEHLVLSALKRSEDGTKQILRVFNASGLESSIVLEVANGFASVEEVTLEEKIIRTVAFKNNVTEAVPVGPGKIMTLAFC